MKQPTKSTKKGIKPTVIIAGTASAALAAILIRSAIKNAQENKQAEQILDNSDGLSPAAYAADLHMAFENDTMFGWGTDEELIYETFKKMPNKAFMADVESSYKRLYGSNLSTDLQEELDIDEFKQLKEIIDGLQGLQGLPIGLKYLIGALAAGSVAYGAYKLTNKKYADTYGSSGGGVLPYVPEGSDAGGSTFVDDAGNIIDNAGNIIDSATDIANSIPLMEGSFPIKAGQRNKKIQRMQQLLIEMAMQGVSDVIVNAGGATGKWDAATQKALDTVFKKYVPDYPYQVTQLNEQYYNIFLNNMRNHIAQYSGSTVGVAGLGNINSGVTVKTVTKTPYRLRSNGKRFVAPANVLLGKVVMDYGTLLEVKQVDGTNIIVPKQLAIEA